MKSPVYVKNKKRIALVFLLICMLMLALMFRMAQHQIVNGKELTEKAIAQQTKDTPIEPKRGIIYDRNNKPLATSTVCYTLWVFPRKFMYSNGVPREEAKIDEMALKLAGVLNMDREEVKLAITKDQSIVRLARYLTYETINKVRDLGMDGISISESSKRHYPNGTLAAQVLGSVTDDNTGRSGLEFQYDEYLSGVAGRWVKNTDVNGNKLVEGSEEYFAAKDGLNLVSTIDELIQHYAEKAVDKGMEVTKAKKITCLVMDPKTGEVLANAVSFKFDPNNPTEPLDEEMKAAVAEMDEKQKNEYIFSLWRNPVVSDVYEPGSTFKLLTTSSALEAGVINVNSRFSCSGSFRVAGITLHCWHAGHGSQGVYDIIRNSCNPAHASIATSMGKDTFYSYLGKYGIMERTGIDIPGETEPIIQTLKNVGPVELCTIGYGHGIALTPIQLLTAANAIGNGGYLIQPRFVKALTDENGKAVKTFEPKVVRNVISAETASLMRDIMQKSIDVSPGILKSIKKYRVGGKTGTADKVEDGQYRGNYNSSFLGMMPMDDPKVSILVVVDSPQGSIYGSTVAMPIAKDVLEEVARYMDIKPSE